MLGNLNGQHMVCFDIRQIDMGYLSMEELAKKLEKIV